MVIGAADIVGILPFESKDDAALIVDPNGVIADAVTLERVKSIAGRHPQVVEFRHRVDLIQFSSDDRPQGFRNPAGCLAVDPVPDVLRRVVGE